MTERDQNTESWNVVSEHQGETLVDSLHRIKVDGGYIYRSVITVATTFGQSICFVPDKE